MTNGISQSQWYMNPALLQGENELWTELVFMGKTTKEESEIAKNKFMEGTLSERLSMIGKGYADYYSSSASSPQSNPDAYIKYSITNIRFFAIQRSQVNLGCSLQGIVPILGNVYKVGDTKQQSWKVGDVHLLRGREVVASIRHIRDPAGVIQLIKTTVQQIALNHY